MGWTSYYATNYKNGKVDRKAECESNIPNGYEIVKSAMVGKVYYAAIRHNDITFAYVVLTSVNNKGYNNFAYKAMTEDVGPCYYDCPVNILNLLSDTDNEFALAWRERCKKQAKLKAEIRKLGKMEVGSIIEGKYKGKDWRLQKSVVSGWKNPIWVDWDKRIYLRPQQIVLNMERV